jgi:hypothetical protein
MSFPESIKSRWLGIFQVKTHSLAFSLRLYSAFFVHCGLKLFEHANEVFHLKKA